MLMKAYGLFPDETPADNFADAGSTYYTNYLSSAKRLGISEGIGDNLFAPESAISRQDMFTLLYRALKVLGELPAATSSAAVESFGDSAVISDYATDAFETFVKGGIVAGSNNLLNPLDTSTRAEMAEVLYNLLTK
jgi:hypothetical protein